MQAKGENRMLLDLVKIIEMLNWLAEVIKGKTSWDTIDQIVYFFWNDAEEKIKGLMVYEFIPGKLVRISINHEAIFFGKKTYHALGNNQLDTQQTWSFQITCEVQEIEKVITWLYLIVNKSENKIKTMTKLPRGFLSLGPENLTPHKYFFSRKALKVMQKK